VCWYGVQAFPSVDGLEARPLPPLGASPDGIIHWPDGRVEALECKNHSPFREGGARGRGQRGRRGRGMVIADGGPFDEVGGRARAWWDVWRVGTYSQASFVQACGYLS
jgi:hypothetical protein